MSWSYDPALISDPTQGPLMQVRFLIQDTTASRPLCQDEELTWLLNNESNVWMAAAAACDSLVARSAGVQNRKVGDLSLTYDPKFYQALALQLRARGAGNQVPYFGAQSVSDKLADQTNPDAIAPAFAVGLDDNPGAPTPSTLPPNPLTRVP